MSSFDADNRELSPRLWLRRMVLFESPEKKTTPIREIRFRRGLNVVWGVELPDNAGADAAHPVTLSGHSVGKTTLCRLIRYCLGEATFGNQGATSRIKNAFPGGWVGLELTVAGQDWSVLRPIGWSGSSKAAKARAVEECFSLEREENLYGEYMNHLRSALMSGLRATTPPNSDRPYDWNHLLAWLTRDQEARFQSLYDWRSPRSEADTPRFQKPKEHALYLIRLVLDLVQEKEIEASRTLTDAEKALNRLDARISELRRQPEYCFNEQEEALKQLLGLPAEEVIHADESDMTSPVFMRRTEIERTISVLQDAIEKLDNEISHKRVAIASYDEDRRLFRSAMETTDEATERHGDNEPEDDTIQKLRDIRGKDCTYGNIPFDKCSYVQDRLAAADGKIIDMQKEREDGRAASETERRLMALEQQREDHDEIVALLNELREKMNKEIADRRSKENELAVYRAQLQRLDYHLEQRRTALALIEGRTPNTELEKETSRAAELRESIESQQTELERLQESFEQRLSAIGSIYDDLIKKALSDSYSGALRMPKGELQFIISEATGLSGEAVETLALVLADVAAMVCSCQEIGHHPGFLLHDSPREADLDRHIYNRYLRSMWTLTEEHGGPDAAPFQYIVTTTSRPPEEIESATCLQLEAHPPDRMLFACFLKNPTTDKAPDLFDVELEHHRNGEHNEPAKKRN